MMLQRSTLQLLRFHFSFFLMPVFWFALSQVAQPDWRKALLIFCILHLLVYPASNGYNSYMDRDQGSIGGLKNPLPPTRQLFYLTLCLDLLATGLSLLIGILFTLGIIGYILASRAYSSRLIRLKKYPVTGYLTVVICQGALIFYLVYTGSNAYANLPAPLTAMVGSSLLIGGFYPLTQIYQHQADLEDGVRTMSWLLGYRGTFLFTAVIYGIAFGTLAYYFFSRDAGKEFWLWATCMLPVLVYFLIWAVKVWKDVREANFINTMRMNLLASLCANTGFILILIFGRQTV
jgi:1,4-dihydroxy-2-naphthoate octaprenyltransferase